MTSHNEAPTREVIVAHCDVELAKQVRDAAMRDQRSISGWVRQQRPRADTPPRDPAYADHQEQRHPKTQDRAGCDRAHLARNQMPPLRQDIPGQATDRRCSGASCRTATRPLLEPNRPVLFHGPSSETGRRGGADDGPRCPPAPPRGTGSPTADKTLDDEKRHDRIRGFSWASSGNRRSRSQKRRARGRSRTNASSTQDRWMRTKNDGRPFGLDSSGAPDGDTEI